MAALAQAIGRDENNSFINPRYSTFTYAAMAATGSAALAVISPVESLRIIGMTVLTGVSYGISNDMIACRDCIEYFTVGHFYDGTETRFRPINTLNPTLNAITWGMIATWHVSAIAGAVFATLARLPIWGMALKITSAQLLPYLAAGAAITFVVSHIMSRNAQRAMQEKMEAGNSGRYTVPNALQAGWHACNVRNSSGYISLGMGGTILSTAIVAARVGLIGL